MQRAVDGHDITLGKHLLEVLDTAAANLLLNLGLEGLVVVVEQLLAVEGLQTTEHTLANTANGYSSDDLVLQVILLLGDSSHIPVAASDLLVRGNEVAHQDEDGHQDVLCHGHDVGPRDLGDGDAAVGLVGGVQIHMVRSNTGRDGNLQLLRLGQALGGEVAGVEAIRGQLTNQSELSDGRGHERSSDDNFGVDKLPVES